MPFVGATLQHWLHERPGGPLEMGDKAGEVLAPLITGWSSKVTHALAAGPLTAAEPREAVVVLPLELIETQLETTEEAGQVKAVPGGDGETRNAVTGWLRGSVAPLAVAARMEHRHPPGDTAPISAKDVEAAFHLSLPLVELPTASAAQPPWRSTSTRACTAARRASRCASRTVASSPARPACGRRPTPGPPPRPRTGSTR